MQRFPYRCNKTKASRMAGRRSPRSPQQRHHQSLWQAKTTFCQDSLYQLSPIKLGRCGIPSRLTFGKRTRASINRASHHHRKGRIIRIFLTLTSSSSPRTPLLRRLFIHCTSASSAYKAIHHTTPHHTGLGYYTTTVARTSINSCVPGSLGSAS